jgi:hypothetical protein
MQSRTTKQNCKFRFAKKKRTCTSFSNKHCSFKTIREYRSDLSRKTKRMPQTRKQISCLLVSGSNRLLFNLPQTADQLLPQLNHHNHKTSFFQCVTKVVNLFRPRHLPLSIQHIALALLLLCNLGGGKGDIGFVRSVEKKGIG